MRLTAGTHLARTLLCSGACALALVCFALASRAELADAAFPGSNGRIAYSRGDDNGANSEIYSMLPDGSGRDNLTEAAGGDDEPAWSADGTKIAFQTNRDGNSEIYTMNADGTGQVNRTRNAAADTEPAWSADGMRIAFVRNFHIWVMNADGGGQTQISSGSLPPVDEAPAWSPDGTKIAFSRTGGFSTNGIFVMNADGSGLVNVDGGAAGTRPSWSPDGARIAFTKTTSGNSDIYVTNANGSGTPSPVVTHPDSDDEAAWSPDGTRIAFETTRTGYWEIFSVDASGGDPRNLTNNDSLSIDDNRPDWGRAQDTVAPTVTITSPPDGAAYALGSSVLANYACADEYSGVATCTGPVASGAPIDTAAAGPKAFTVTASDKAGNTTSLTHAYTVAGPLAGPLAGVIDTIAPILDVRAKRRQKAGEPIRLRLTSNEDSAALAGGTIVVRPRVASTALRRVLRFPLKLRRATLGAGVAKVFRLRPKGGPLKSRRTLRRIRRLVLDKNRATARVRLSAKDATGNTSIARIRIKLVR